MTREQGGDKEHFLQDLYERVVDEPSKSIKNILLTGGAGFTGSFLAKKLVINYPEYNVVVLDKLDYCSSLSNLAPLVERKNFRFIKGDITDLSFVRSLIREHEIDTILHLAAQTHVDKSFGESIEFTKNNVLGTHVLLEAAHSYHEPLPTAPVAAVSTALPAPPSCSFVPVVDVQCNGVRVNEESSSTAAVNGVTTNPVGRPRSSSLTGLRSRIKRFIYISTDEVYGEVDQGKHSRKYLYVADVANAIDIVLHKGVIGQVYNIGCGHEITNIDMARLLIRRLTHGKRKRNGFTSEDGRSDRSKPYSGQKPSSSSLPSSSSSSSSHQSQQENGGGGEELHCNGHVDGNLVRDSDGEPVSSAIASACSPSTATSAEAFSDERIVFVEDRAFNDKRYDVDSTKIQELGWAPRTSFEEGIEKTGK
ncbi:hypothetical protein DFQ26_008463 [Actinomortierella ambigua]|nr:hypothetical protein DFQ26_008463 [Actinomortierella ambigua]